MKDSNNKQQDHTLDAIAAVAHQGEKRFVYISLGIIVTVVIVFGFLLVRHINRLPELADVPIAIFLPRIDEGSAQDNARRQAEGFYQAYFDNDLMEPEDQQESQHLYYFNYQLKQGPTPKLDKCDLEAIAGLAEKSEFGAKWQKVKCWNSPYKFGNCDSDYITELAKSNDAAAILQRMKCGYHNDGIRIFIITMSGAVKFVRQKFIDWANTLNPNDRPILLATVVSAPEVANSGDNVFRHYIRSRDESDTLATYIESLHPSPSRIGIIHVDDEYGRSARDLLIARLGSASVNAHIVPFDIVQPGTTTTDEFEKFMNAHNDLAVVIGYGSMIKITLDRLKTREFKGPILLVSTFTEEDWRPEREDKDKCFWDQIRYVGPITADPETDRRRRGVVFQFSYLTLDRALKCRDERGVENFWPCFTNDKILKNPGKKWNPQIEFTRQGDSHVSLGIFKLTDDVTPSDECPVNQDPG